MGIKGGTTGLSRFSVLSEKYCPRFTVAGSYAALSGVSDGQKFCGAQIDMDGNGCVYLSEPLSYYEKVTFVYPLR